MQFKLGFQYMLFLCPWQCAYEQHVLLTMSVRTVSIFELYYSQFIKFCLLVVVLVSRPDGCVVRLAFLNLYMPVDHHQAVWCKYVLTCVVLFALNEWDYLCTRCLFTTTLVVLLDGALFCSVLSQRCVECCAVLSVSNAQMSLGGLWFN